MSDIVYRVSMDKVAAPGGRSVDKMLGQYASPEYMEDWAAIANDEHTRDLYLSIKELGYDLSTKDKARELFELAGEGFVGELSDYEWANITRRWDSQEPDEPILDWSDWSTSKSRSEQDPKIVIPEKTLSEFAIGTGVGGTGAEFKKNLEKILEEANAEVNRIIDMIGSDTNSFSQAKARFESLTKSISDKGESIFKKFMAQDNVKKLVSLIELKSSSTGSPKPSSGGQPAKPTLDEETSGDASDSKLISKEDVLAYVQALIDSATTSSGLDLKLLESERKGIEGVLRTDGLVVDGTGEDAAMFFNRSVLEAVKKSLGRPGPGAPPPAAQAPVDVMEMSIKELEDEASGIINSTLNDIGAVDSNKARFQAKKYKTKLANDKVKVKGSGESAADVFDKIFEQLLNDALT